MNDIVIKNGTVIDGTGRPAFKADIAVSDGKISDIGVISGRAKTEIDATGHYVVPGFIDVTNHSDVTAAIFRSPELESMIRQGITTIIGGNCGTSLAPLVSPDLIHGIRKWAPTSSINVNWLSVAEFLREVEKLRLASNFGTLIGHGTMRRGITKEELRALSLEETAQIKSMIQQGLKEGALGISTSLSSSHEQYASADELTNIAMALATEGGVYKTHLRHEGVSLIAGVNEALRVANEARVPVSISHLKAVGKKAWPLMRRAISMINRTVRSGGRVIYDITPYRTTGSQLYSVMPQWARDGGFTKMLERLREKESREKVIEAIAELTLHFDRIRVAEAEDGISPGKTIKELAERAGKSPQETMVDLIIANHGRVSIIGKTLHTKNIRLGVKGVASTISTNGSAYDFGTPGRGGLPHPRSFGTFPRFFRRYVVEEHLLGWEEAVIKCTSLPADFFGIRDRGKLQIKYAADIVVLSPDTIRDKGTYDNPYMPPEGVKDVLVNGALAVRDGITTGQRAGQVIRKS